MTHPTQHLFRASASVAAVIVSISLAPSLYAGDGGGGGAGDRGGGSGGGGGGAGDGGGGGDVVLDWNGFISDLIINDSSLENPGSASRSMAMMNLAIYDSVALAKGKHSFYDYSGFDIDIKKASGQVAAAQASYAVLSSIYGGSQQSTIDAFLESSLSQYKNNAAKTAGIALGNQVAEAIIDIRANDGYDGFVQYTPSGEIGGWEPDPVNPDQEAWGPAWGSVETFAIGSVDPYLPVAPPDLTSQAYADAYNEVKELGSIDSAVRTADQTEIGLFWAYDRAELGTPLTFFNEAIQAVAIQENNSFKENVELFTMATVAMADAGIVAWNSKFEHDLWRPVSGIRDGDLDGNPLTEGVSDWTPLGAPDGEELTGFTPPFPTYVSGHATFGGALFEVLELWYGEDLEFSLTSAELEHLLLDENADLLAEYGLEDLEDATRTFTFSEAAQENSDSRVYLGIHWNYDSTEGQLAGEAVAQSLFENRLFGKKRFLARDGLLVAVPEPSTVMLLACGLIAVARRRSIRVR